MILSIVLALSIVFPLSNVVLPSVDKTYMSGAVNRGITNITVQGKSVPVYFTGGWVTMVDVKEGANNIEIKAGGLLTNFVVNVAKKIKHSSSDSDKVKKVYNKLPYAGDWPRALPKVSDRQKCFIVLDPGHGGKNDRGAVSPHGYFEKDANLLLSKEIRRELQNLGFGVIMTRERDIRVDLFERPKLACTNSNVIAFVSVHHNAPACNVDPRVVRYASVYAWNDIGVDLAKAISDSVGKALTGDIPNKGVMRGNLVVTRNPEVASCLVEADFITTPEGEFAIWDYKRRRKIAKAVA
jgi:N-acetylmuramoyl-L-alanine amidase